MVGQHSLIDFLCFHPVFEICTRGPTKFRDLFWVIACTWNNNIKTKKGVEECICIMWCILKYRTWQQKAILALSALARAMKEMNKVAIVRCVWRQGQGNVVVGVLTPNVSDKDNTVSMIQIFTSWLFCYLFLVDIPLLDCWHSHWPLLAAWFILLQYSSLCWGCSGFPVSFFQQFTFINAAKWKATRRSR